MDTCSLSKGSPQTASRAFMMFEACALTFVATCGEERSEGAAERLLFPASTLDYAESRRAESPVWADFGLLRQRKARRRLPPLRQAASADRRWSSAGPNLNLNRSDSRPLMSHSMLCVILRGILDDAPLCTTKMNRNIKLTGRL